MKATLETRGGQTVGINNWTVWEKCLGRDTYLGLSLRPWLLTYPNHAKGSSYSPLLSSKQNRDR